MSISNWLKAFKTLNLFKVILFSEYQKESMIGRGGTSILITCLAKAVVATQAVPVREEKSILGA
jgi:hypothetical protein